ncbi:hypothetical protein PENSPDRAFT_283726 [Peniophora sp. CONT]|nr:hypothetical protein PENSPDRAFT_283726 [Peniophora sp. CONT]
MLPIICLMGLLRAVYEVHLCTASAAAYASLDADSACRVPEREASMHRSYNHDQSCRMIVQVARIGISDIMHDANNRLLDVAVNCELVEVPRASRYTGPNDHSPSGKSVYLERVQVQSCSHSRSLENAWYGISSPSRHLRPLLQCHHLSCAIGA